MLGAIEAGGTKFVLAVGPAPDWAAPPSGLRPTDRVPP